MDGNELQARIYPVTSLREISLMSLEFATYSINLYDKNQEYKEDKHIFLV